MTTDGERETERPREETTTASNSSTAPAAAKESPAKAPPEWAKEREDAATNSTITNSDEPRLVKARIFVGNLPADLRTEKGELFDKFRKHGRILGVSIHNRYAFVQFDKEADARAAVKAEQHTEFRAARLDVKMSAEGRVTGNNNRDRERDRDRDRDRPLPPRRRSRSPIDRRPNRPRSRSRDRTDRDRRGNSRYSNDRYRDSRERSRSPPPYVPIPVEERFCHPRTYGPNDVEMVVIRKQQGQYADSILRRLYDRRVAANMLFLAEHASLEGAVTEFGRCGSHYVIIIMPKHEDTRAITVNIFEVGEKPREYRNISLEEGITLICRHFRDHFPALSRLREMEYQGPGFYPTAPSEVMRTLARMVETCAVPTTSLDSTIRYLQDMRDRTAIAEGIAISGLPAATVTTVASSIPPPQAVSAYRAGGATADIGLVGKVLAQLDDRGRPMASEESVRESLLGLLKATGIVGGLQGVGAATTNNANQSTNNYGSSGTHAGSDYYSTPQSNQSYGSSTVSSTSTPYNTGQYGQTQPSAGSGTATQYTTPHYGSSTVSSSGQYSTASGNASNYGSSQTNASTYGSSQAADNNANIHKSYDNLVSSGVLRPGQASQSQQQQQPAHTPPVQGGGGGQVTSQGISSYQRQVKEENGIGHDGYGSSQLQQQQQPMRYATSQPMSTQQATPYGSTLQGGAQQSAYMAGYLQQQQRSQQQQQQQTSQQQSQGGYNTAGRR